MNFHEPFEVVIPDYYSEESLERKFKRVLGGLF